MDRSRHRRDRENPSFSSTLLDEIYRSIDEGAAGEEELILYRETMRKKQSNYGLDQDDDEDMAGVRRACMIGKWMEKKVSEKVVVRRKTPAADFERKSRSDRGGSVFLNSSSSSSDSSCGGGFSSSEAEIENVYGVSLKSSNGGYTAQRPKPIRTTVSVPPEKFNAFDTYSHENRYVPDQKPKHEGGFVKTKSRALKIYGDLKKVKQPISPGGKLASFLNSLFTAGNAKKAKISSSVGGGYDDMRSDRKVSKSADSAHGSTTCSSASSFSRSCLSKTPSSRGKSSNGMKRSVRFYPVSVIVDEDSRPCGHKSLYEDEQSHVQAVKSNRNSMNEELQFQIMEKHRRVEEAARDLLRNYQKKVECEFDWRSVHNNNNNNNNNVKFNNADEDEDEDEDEDDDAASYASSDLFELDNLSAIGIDRYREELPVYETTHLNTNRAIANGFM